LAPAGLHFRSSYGSLAKFAAIRRASSRESSLAADRWKSVKITEFERRQLSALKTELDQEYEAQVDLNRKLSKATAQTKISSSSQT
jgi:hypothetical protein